MKKVAFYTLGCKVNQYETNGMIQKLSNKYDIVSTDEKADIYIINTCSVTNLADRKSRQMIRRAKEKNPESLVIAVGCYAQVAKDEIEKINEVDIVLGNSQKIDIEKYIEAFFEGKKTNDITVEKYYRDFGSITYTEKTRAVIKVQDGCNNFCTYCIIPYARGRICSRSKESVIDEITKIANNGIKEVVITGIEVAAYGKDFDEKYELIDLLEDINKIEGIERIRLGSLQPLLITDEFCTRISKIDKLCHHFHLSLQSGCDKTLKEMNRKYTTEEFRNVVKKLRDLYQDVILTTDIIVGFPNETDADFEKTYKFLSEIKFYKMHVFKYSQRKGTVAAKMKGQVSGEVKEIRSKRLIELSNTNEREYLKTYVGKNVEVLFEEREGKYIKGHTANYIMVKFLSDDNIIGELKSVFIKDYSDEFLYA